MDPGILRELAAGGGIGGFFLALIAVAESAARRGLLAPESARKAIHIGGGIGCLSFPFLLSSRITVLALAAGFALVLHIGESRKRLRSLSGVGRSGIGSLLFPVAVFILYVADAGRLWLFVSAMLILALADGAAALAGTRFGRLCYQTAPGMWKSLEGTLAFFGVGWLAVFLPLLLLADIPAPSCLLIGLLMALLLAGIEAVSIGGTDNLFVPLGTCFLLHKLPDKPPLEIAFQCLSLLVVAGVVTASNARSRTLNIRLLIIFILASYSAWALGSAEWMIPGLVGFMIYNGLCRDCRPLPESFTARALFRPLYAPLLILFAANATLRLSFWYVPFLGACAVSVSLSIVNRHRLSAPANPPLRLPARAALAILPPALPLLLCMPLLGTAPLAVLPAVTTVCALAVFSYMFLLRRHASRFLLGWGVAAFGGGSALLCALLQWGGLTPALNPSRWMDIFR